MKSAALNFARPTRFMEWAREVYRLARTRRRSRPGLHFLASAYESGATVPEALRIWQDVPRKFREAEGLRVRRRGGRVK